jgi:hypothetical protein
MTRLAEASEMPANEGGARSGLRDVADVLPSTRWLIVLLVPLAALKCLQVFAAAPTADEAYYWLWGQHLSLSYFDHPPLAAWLQRASAELFGWNLVGLRAAAIASFAGSLWILWFWCRRLAAPGDALQVFLGGVIVWLSVPMLMRFQSLAHQDHLLVFFGLLTAHFFALFHENLDAGSRPWRYFYLGCVALGLAGLSKYNAVFIGLGFAAWVVFSGQGRRLLLSPHLWAGAAIALLMQTPVLVWNIAHDWPSFQYNLESRIGQSNYSGFGDNLLSFTISTVILVSPVFLVAMVRFAAGRSAVPFQPLGRWVFILSTAAFAAFCATNTVLYYWNLAAYILALPVIVFFIRSRLEFVLHAVYGIALAVWLVGFHQVYPGYKLGGNDIRDNDISFGLREIASIVQEEEARLGADMIVATDYRIASLLSFASGRTDIAKIGRRDDQFDFWFDPTGHKGQNALVIVDDYLPETDIVTQVFETVTPVREFTVRRFGLPMHSYRLVWAENYSGEGPH